MFAARRIVQNQIARPTQFRSLSCSVPVFAQSKLGQSDSDLALKLTSELKQEKANMDQEETQVWLDKFKSTPWKILDTPGDREVSLVRQFGNEKIRAIFSTDAINEANEDDDMEYDEESQGEDDESPESFPVNLTILIEKAENKGALEIEAQIIDNSFYIENVSFGKSELINDPTAEGDWQRRNLYSGPVFNNLDEDLQEEFHKYLQERGFDEELAELVPSYIEYKEQKEYMSWLDRVSKFVSL